MGVRRVLDGLAALGVDVRLSPLGIDVWLAMLSIHALVAKALRGRLPGVGRCISSAVRVAPDAVLDFDELPGIRCR